eukprot:scaffold88386_cov57-Phaeocystis_antarctica.AAC.3
MIRGKSTLARCGVVSAASHRVRNVYIYDAYTTPPRSQVSVDLVKGRVRVGVTDGVRVGVGIRVRVRVRGGG